MTILIVEGPDLSGKSYAISKIAKHFNSGYILKNSYKPKRFRDSKELLQRYWAIINQIRFPYRQSDIIILDRFYPSQMVYSFLRGIEEMHSNELLMMDRTCAALHAILIYLDTPLEILKERYLERGDEHIKIDQLEILHQRYQKFLDITELSIMKLNTRAENWLQKFEEELKNELDKNKNTYNR